MEGEDGCRVLFEERVEATLTIAGKKKRRAFVWARSTRRKRVFSRRLQERQGGKARSCLDYREAHNYLQRAIEERQVILKRRRA